MATTSQSRHSTLDVLRAVAVFLVIGHHLIIPDSSSAAIRVWKRGGWAGVDLFFVLSGFLISGLLFREYIRHGSVSVGRFLIRRGLKIYPAFYVFLFSTILAITIRGRAADWQLSFGTIASECLFLQNYLWMIWGHTWSLAVEEHFYIGISLIVALLVRFRPVNPFSGIPCLFLVIAVSEFVLRMANTYQPYHFYSQLGRTHLRVDSLLCGVVLAYWFHFSHSRFSAIVQLWRAPLAVLSVLLVLPLFACTLGEAPWLVAAGPTLMYLSSGALLACALASPISVSAVFRPVASIGTFSYSIYLWHMPVLTWLVPLIQRRVVWANNEWVYAAIACALSVCVGILFSLIVEYPVLSVRDRWFPSKSN